MKNYSNAYEPSFYQNDIDNYFKKFKNSIEERNKIKLQMKKLYNQGFGDTFKNKNVSQPKLQRIPSRNSNTNFCNIDFDAYGNTREVSSIFQF